MEQFTASEVRDRKRFEEWYATHSFNYSRDPIGSRDCSLQWEAWKAARADLLEAREIARNDAIEREYERENNPALSDAERLANCVLAIIEPYLDTGDSRTAPDWAVAIYRVLAAHPAQAQPPAVSVTDAMVERAFDKLLADGLDDLDRPKIEGMRAALEAALAAQESPNGV